MLRFDKELGRTINVPMTVEDLINELHNFNPKAIVKIHTVACNDDAIFGKGYIMTNRKLDCATHHSFEGDMPYVEDECWLSTEGII